MAVFKSDQVKLKQQVHKITVLNNCLIVQIINILGTIYLFIYFKANPHNTLVL